MGHNAFARQQLLELVDELDAEMRDIEFLDSDSVVDFEHKRGIKQAFRKSIDMTFSKAEKLKKNRK